MYRKVGLYVTCQSDGTSVLIGVGLADHTIPLELKALGLPLRNGAALIQGEQTWHGSEAIAELSRRMNPSDPLLGLLAKLFSDNQRSALAYPALLAVRRLALATRGLSVDPDQARSR